ncbi:hypothetical protein SCLCIDRAFT_1215836 [Scleroderma citrinum Foug A]|uniref:Uncharacterized protein n=1 Tax=Scleroderma citrinum Foug A TaxID=1036808 RepID=A0A0C3DZU0_9AGAM|nr:hypothetical protein SCLCIDRAFT_1215836 [Scleroderma citrinum Foug A]
MALLLRRTVHVRDEEHVRRAVVVVRGVGRIGVDEEGLDGVSDDGRQTLCYTLDAGGVGGILEGHGARRQKRTASGVLGSEGARRRTHSLVVEGNEVHRSLMRAGRRWVLIAARK